MLFPSGWNADIRAAQVNKITNIKPNNLDIISTSCQYIPLTNYKIIKYITNIKLTQYKMQKQCFMKNNKKVYTDRDKYETE